MSIRSAVMQAVRGVRDLATEVRVSSSRAIPDTPIPTAERPGESLHRATHEYPRLLYWTDTDPPQSFIRHDVSPGDRALVAHALTRGWAVLAYGGNASCRICGEVLGDADKAVHGMIYPSKAEHYLIEHDVWTPGCDELLRRLQFRSRT
jgi:hypothetical protein